MKAQRLRFRYSLGEEACKLSQRDLVTAWEDAFAAAGLNIAHTEGKRSSTLISIAAPLPQGVTSTCEIIDVFLADAVSSADVAALVAPHLPTGVVIRSVEEVGVSAPSVQSQVCWAEYEVAVEGIDLEALQRAVRGMLEARSLPSEYRREKKVREYDLRPLILDLQVRDGSGHRASVVMRLRAEPERNARADQVAAALGLADGWRIVRTKLVLEEVPPALAAYRRAGERDES